MDRLVRETGGGCVSWLMEVWSSEVPHVPVVCPAGVRPAVHTVPPVSLPWPVSGWALSVPGWPGNTVQDIQWSNISTSIQEIQVESKSAFVKCLIISSNSLKEFKIYDHMSVQYLVYWSWKDNRDLNLQITFKLLPQYIKKRWGVSLFNVMMTAEWCNQKQNRLLDEAVICLLPTTWSPRTCLPRSLSCYNLPVQENKRAFHEVTFSGG